jgi:hypothetical protein
MSGNPLAQFIFSCCFLFLFTQETLAQKDTLRPERKRFMNNIFKRVSAAVTVSKKDSALAATILNTQSESPFFAYEGKVIRSISTQELGFEITFTDTSKRINYFGTRILNALHTDSRGWVIRNNLFIKKGRRVNPYVFADNERFLRSLEFIQDVRIEIKPVSGSPDSVDVVVITKDLFSITGSFDAGGTDRQRIKIAETNLAGMGQKIQFTALRDKDRKPVYGYDFLYKKTNIAHSFINASVGFSEIRDDRSGDDAERSLYLQLSRPLVSPYSYFAGGLDISFTGNQNLYRKPDSLFYSYKYAYFDGWIGYNMGVSKLIQNNSERSRSFIALRYLSSNFNKKPFQVGSRFDPFFNSRQAALGELTFFRQNFYKTNYIYGFGTTEDVPYGYNVAFTAGWYKQLDLARPYVGLNASRYIVTQRGGFKEFFFRTGGFYKTNKFEDASILTGMTMYSRLFLFDKLKVRQYAKASFTRLFNRVAYDPLRINNVLGLQHFKADSLTGKQRVSVYGETFFFPTSKLFGFQMAPFAFVDASMLTPERRHLSKSDIYTGIGGGIRTRNENLVFGTLELRAVYFPRKAQDMNTFRVTFKANLRFRYNSNYIRPPDIIQLNVEDINSFY